MATKSIAWTTGTGNITLTYQGQGDGPISIQSDANNIGSARSQVITVETVGGAITRGFTISQAACPFPVGDVRNFSYTGSDQEVELPAGQYKLQCWGAQGGSNAAASSYGITAQSGGKGGYSEGIITLTQKTIVKVNVGGAGTSSAGGFNGGGSTTGSSTYNASNEQGVSRMGGGGGATDIRLSDGALLSRMIVAGGGSGGAYVFRQKSEEISEEVTRYCDLTADVRNINLEFKNGGLDVYSEPSNDIAVVEVTALRGKTLTFDFNGTMLNVQFLGCDPTIGFHSGETQREYLWDAWGGATHSGTWTYTIPSYCTHMAIYTRYAGTPFSYSVYYTDIETHTETTETTDYRYGYHGGGTAGDGYSNSYKGRQNAAGTGGSFGQGANQTTTNYRYCSGAGGGGWYGGGGGQYSDNDMNTVHLSGGGSGFVNTAASAGNRPSGYTGLQLDSGTLYAGNTSFPAPGGGNETGHSGNGYAKITRLA